jgi:type II secretory pathway component PulM
MTQAFLTPLLDVWHSREPRERLLVSLAAAVLLLGGLYAWVLDPALQTTQRLKTELPLAQTKLAQVQQLSLAAKANATGSSAAPNQASLQTGLSAAGINATVSAAAPWLVTINGAAGEPLWLWLKTHPTSKSTLKRNANGSWQGELTLETE